MYFFPANPGSMSPLKNCSAEEIVGFTLIEKINILFQFCAVGFCLVAMK